MILSCNISKLLNFLFYLGNYKAVSVIDLKNSAIKCLTTLKIHIISLRRFQQR